MSTIVTLERSKQSQDHVGRTDTDQEISWADIMREIGYPESWAEEVRKSLAAQGKTFHWRKVTNQ